MFPQWVEAVVPLVIIAGALTTMGSLQTGVHKLFYGKPKALGQDRWDYMIQKRDQRIRDEASS